jgi:hypothetical protein
MCTRHASRAKDGRLSASSGSGGRRGRWGPKQGDVTLPGEYCPRVFLLVELQREARATGQDDCQD